MTLIGNRALASISCATYGIVLRYPEKKIKEQRDMIHVKCVHFVPISTSKSQEKASIVLWLYTPHFIEAQGLTDVHYGKKTM
eukprot:1143719-Pelagomonas_calceolata.AAC.1